MNSKVSVFLFTVLILIRISHFYKIIPDERIATCDGEYVKEGEVYIGNAGNVSGEFILEIDNRIRMVGGLHIKEEIDSPFFYKLVAEKLLPDGQWALKFTKTAFDACKDFFNPADVYYPFFKDKKRCPWPPGVNGNET